MRTLNAGTPEFISKKNRVKFLTLHSPFCPFLILELNCHSAYFRVYISEWNYPMHFKMVHSNTKNAKSRVRQSQMCYGTYAQPIPQPLK